jgi:Domain of unknown function (DUF397)
MTPFTNPVRATGWRKASFCQGGECVEVRSCGDTVQVRSSNEPHEIVTLTAQEWLVFVDGVRHGDFESLSNFLRARQHQHGNAPALRSL